MKDLIIKYQELGDLIKKVSRNTQLDAKSKSIQEKQLHRKAMDLALKVKAELDRPYTRVYYNRWSQAQGKVVSATRVLSGDIPTIKLVEPLLRETLGVHIYKMEQLENKEELIDNPL